MDPDQIRMMQQFLRHMQGGGPGAFGGAGFGGDSEEDEGVPEDESGSQDGSEDHAEASTEEEEEPDEDVELLESLESLTAQRLQKELKARDLPTTGTRATLADRLREHLISALAKKRKPSKKQRRPKPEGMEDDSDEDSFTPSDGLDDEEDFDGDEEDFYGAEQMFENMFGGARVNKGALDTEEWTALWIEIAGYLRDDDLLYTTFNRAVRCRVTPNPKFDLLPDAELAKLESFVDAMTKKTIKPAVVPPEFLADGKQRLPDLLEKAKESSSFMRSLFSGDEFADKYGTEIENFDDLPELYGARLRAVRVGGWTPLAEWDGQFLLRFNVVTQALEVEFFRYKASESKNPTEFKKMIKKHGPMNTAVMDYVFDQLQAFEVTRHLRLSYPFESITAIQLCEHDGNGFLVVDLAKKPTFSTRRVNTLAHKHREWKERADFTASKQASIVSRLVFSSHLDSLRKSLALAIQSYPKLGELLSKGVDWNQTDLEFAESDSETKAGSAAQAHVPGKLQPEYLAELVAQSLLTEQAAAEVDPLAPFGICFKDYLMYRVESVADLRSALGNHFTTTSTGIFDLDEYKGETVLHYLQHSLKHPEEGKFYSFCRNQIVEAQDDHHCIECHLCLDARYSTHCSKCDHCSIGIENTPNCTYCGWNSRDPHAPMKPTALSIALIRENVDPRLMDDPSFADEATLSDDAGDLDEPSWRY